MEAAWILNRTCVHCAGHVLSSPFPPPARIRSAGGTLPLKSLPPGGPRQRRDPVGGGEARVLRGHFHI